ncbi:helix-turn-helix domain-containing protein [Flavobacterium lacustre]|uniref:helix-turn-helix domain-containing protein n=1 Tax=Flavobacterium lacustre TaxID=3016339 RepID=UPI0022B71D9B|nr:helix-turn-helix domain-containing protein [Flavobacterium lacustre]
MRINFILFLFFIQFGSCFSQNDTILNKVVSHPFYYNIIQDKDGNIYTGSSGGVQKWEGEMAKSVQNELGYVDLNNKGELEVRRGGIKKYENRKFNHLLPYPNDPKEQFYAKTEKKLYIVTGGRLYLFDIIPYSIIYRNHSIRTISKNYVGTYSGIYRKGTKLEFPPFTEGHIREIEDTGYIYFSNQLLLISADRPEKNSITKIKMVARQTLGEVDDIFYDTKNQFIYYFCNNGMYKTDKYGKQAKFIYRKKGQDPVLFTSKFENIIMFCSEENFMIYDLISNKISTNFSLPSTILSAIYLNGKNYLLTTNELYAETDTGFSKIAEFNDAHTLLSINDKQLIVATNFGLYTYNLETKEIQIVINGVEFNKRALYTEKNILYAGSINGLYKIDLNKLQLLIDNNKSKSQITYQNNHWTILTAVLLCVIFLLIFVLIKVRKKLKLKESTVLYQKKISRNDIIQFIENNISTVGIKTINEHFKINTIQLYNLLKPKKPGNIITDLRKELVVKLRKEGKNVKEISEATGFSETYIYRVKLKE